MTAKHIIYQAGDGTTCIVTPAPWARHVKAVTVDGTRLAIDPPQPLDRWLRRGVSAEEFAALDVEFAETEEAFLARLQERCVPPDATDIRIVERAEIPTDRTFRNALKSDLTHDMEKCRSIWRDKMRDARKRLLAALDVEYQRADETGDAQEKLSVAAAKRELRDVTAVPEIDAAKTPEELKAVWPECLGNVGL